MKKNGKKLTHLASYIEDKLINDIGVSIRHAETCMHLKHGALKNFIQKKCNLSGTIAIRLERVFGVEAFNSKELLMMQDDFILASEANASGIAVLEPFDPKTVRTEKGKHPRAIPV